MLAGILAIMGGIWPSLSSRLHVRSVSLQLYTCRTRGFPCSRPNLLLERRPLFQTAGRRSPRQLVAPFVRVPTESG